MKLHHFFKRQIRHYLCFHGYKVIVSASTWCAIPHQLRFGSPRRFTVPVLSRTLWVHALSMKRRCSTVAMVSALPHSYYPLFRTQPPAHLCSCCRLLYGGHRPVRQPEADLVKFALEKIRTTMLAMIGHGKEPVARLHLCLRAGDERERPMAHLKDFVFQHSRSFRQTVRHHRP